MPSAAQILATLPETSALRLASSLAPPGMAVGTGIAELDAVLGGGLPRGRIAELVGPHSAGRTGLALAIAASATRRGEVIAWIDVEDALDPPSFEAAEADLARVLWVRPSSVIEAFKAADAVLDAGGFSLVVLDFGDARESSRGRPTSWRARQKRGGDAAWTRLLHRAERSSTTVLVSGPAEIAGAHATVALAVVRERAVLAGCPALLERIDARVRLARCRFRPPGADAPVSLVAAG